MAQIEAEDLPEDVTVLREKIAATISMAMMDVVETSLVEACTISGLDYDEIAEIAARCDLDPDELNKAGLEIVDDPDDVERRERDGYLFIQCADCGEQQRFDYWKSERGGWRIMSVECSECGGEGSRWTCGVGDPDFFGVWDETVK